MTRVRPFRLILSLLAVFTCATGTARKTLGEQERSGLSIDEQKLPIAYALRLTTDTDSDGFPGLSAWQEAPSSKFDRDWQGKNADAARETEVRILWTPDSLYFQFRSRYRTITVFPDARPDGWRDKLWDRDVAEVFLQPDSSDPLRYKEFEISPNGFWIDLDVSHGQIAELKSGLRRRVRMDAQNKMWTAELCIPMKSLTKEFNPSRGWRLNFFRVEGEKEPRFYSAWSPTNSPAPNFHVPAAFGRIVFQDHRGRDRY